MSKLKLFFVFLFCFSHSLSAAIWEINKDHSEIFFQVPYLTVSEVTGRFNKFSGQVDFPEGKRLPSHVRIAIETASLDTGNRQRDGHLRSQEFLKTSTHPYMTFESNSFSEIKAGEFRAQGMLSLGGVTKPFSINFTMTDAVKDTWNYESRFVRFRSKINRREFQIVWNKTLTGNQYLVGEDITFWGAFQLQPENIKTPSSKHMIPDTAYIRTREKFIRGEITQDEFNKATGNQTSVTPTKEKQPEVNPLPQPTITPVKEKTIEIRDRTIWQIAFGILGLLGFFACIFISLYTKKIVSEHWPEKYREGGLFGILTDSIGIPLVFLYALALWEVGWG